jgi:hypothetical protein
MMVMVCGGVWWCGEWGWGVWWGDEKHEEENENGKRNRNMYFRE